MKNKHCIAPHEGALPSGAALPEEAEARLWRVSPSSGFSLSKCELDIGELFAARELRRYSYVSSDSSFIFSQIAASDRPIRKIRDRDVNIILFCHPLPCI